MDDERDEQDRNPFTNDDGMVFYRQADIGAMSDDSLKEEPDSSSNAGSAQLNSDTASTESSFKTTREDIRGEARHEFIKLRIQKNDASNDISKSLDEFSTSLTISGTRDLSASQTLSPRSPPASATTPGSGQKVPGSFIIKALKSVSSDKPKEGGTCEFATFDILEFHPKDLARQLALIDAEHFRRIERSELESLAWTGAQKHEKAPNIVVMIQFFNEIAGLLSEIHGHQMTCIYSFEPIPTIRNAILSIRYDPELQQAQENEQYKASYQLEPKEGEGPNSSSGGGGVYRRELPFLEYLAAAKSPHSSVTSTPTSTTSATSKGDKWSVGRKDAGAQQTPNTIANQDPDAFDDLDASFASYPTDVLIRDDHPVPLTARGLNATPLSTASMSASSTPTGRPPPPYSNNHTPNKVSFELTHHTESNPPNNNKLLRQIRSFTAGVSSKPALEDFPSTPTPTSQNHQQQQQTDHVLALTTGKIKVGPPPFLSSSSSAKSSYHRRTKSAGESKRQSLMMSIFTQLTPSSSQLSPPKATGNSPIPGISVIYEELKGGPSSGGRGASEEKVSDVEKNPSKGRYIPYDIGLYEDDDDDDDDEEEDDDDDGEEGFDILHESGRSGRSTHDDAVNPNHSKNSSDGKSHGAGQEGSEQRFPSDIEDTKDSTGTLLSPKSPQLSIVPSLSDDDIFANGGLAESPPAVTKHHGHKRDFSFEKVKQVFSSSHRRDSSLGSIAGWVSGVGNRKDSTQKTAAGVSSSSQPPLLPPQQDQNQQEHGSQKHPSRQQKARPVSSVHILGSGSTTTSTSAALSVPQSGQRVSTTLSTFPGSNGKVLLEGVLWRKEEQSKEGSWRRKKRKWKRVWAVLEEGRVLALWPYRSGSTSSLKSSHNSGHSGVDATVRGSSGAVSSVESHHTPSASGAPLTKGSLTAVGAASPSSLLIPPSPIPSAVSNSPAAPGSAVSLMTTVNRERSSLLSDHPLTNLTEEENNSRNSISTTSITTTSTARTHLVANPVGEDRKRAVVRDTLLLPTDSPKSHRRRNESLGAAQSGPELRDLGEDPPEFVASDTVDFLFPAGPNVGGGRRSGSLNDIKAVSVSLDELQFRGPEISMDRLKHPKTKKPAIYTLNPTTTLELATDYQKRKNTFRLRNLTRDSIPSSPILFRAEGKEDME
ncbi:Ras-specific guanine nucleotide-releasing factor RalGPS1, partial [Quaeritorhiza haematococci]